MSLTMFCYISKFIHSSFPFSFYLFLYSLFLYSHFPSLPSRSTPSPRTIHRVSAFPYKCLALSQYLQHSSPHSQSPPPSAEKTLWAHVHAQTLHALLLQTAPQTMHTDDTAEENRAERAHVREITVTEEAHSTQRTGETRSVERVQAKRAARAHLHPHEITAHAHIQLHVH